MFWYFKKTHQDDKNLFSYTRFLFLIAIANATPTTVLTSVATIPAPTIPAGFTLPY